MALIASTPLPDSATEESRGIDALPSTAWDRVQWLRDASMLGAAAGNAQAQLGTVDDYGRQVSPPEPSMPAKDAQEKYGIPGHLTFGNDLPESVARQMNSDKRDELLRQNMAARSPGGAGSWLADQGLGLVSMALDPVDLASAFVPGLGGEALAARLGLGKLGGRAITGATAGAFGQAALVPLRAAVSANEQLDYSMNDALQEIAMGGLFGGALHVAGGLAGDALDRLFNRSSYARAVDNSPDVRAAALNAAIAAVVEDRPVEVRPIFESREGRISANDVRFAIDRVDTERPEIQEALTHIANTLEDREQTLTPSQAMDAVNLMMSEKIFAPEAIDRAMAGLTQEQRADIERNVGYAWGREQPEDAAVRKLVAEGSASASAKPITSESGGAGEEVTQHLADLKQSLAQADAEGRLTEADREEMAMAGDQSEVQSFARGLAQAASCLLRAAF